MDERIRLGIVRKDIKPTQSYNPEKDHLSIDGEVLYITKHSWDCDWYWGFGYIGNKNLHCHSEVFINELIWHDVNEVFEDSIFKNNNDFWIFKDLLKQAYALKECAEIYRHGGNCTTKEGITDIIKSPEMEKKLNEDLKKVLDKLWDFLKSPKQMDTEISP